MPNLADKSTKLLKLVDDIHRYAHNPRFSAEHYWLVAADAKELAQIATEIGNTLDVRSIK